MNIAIDKIRNDFFKKSLSVGHHNACYLWKHLMLMIISCVRSLESFEEGAKSPSAQTLRDRLNLTGEWLASFHRAMWTLAVLLVKRFSRMQWFISVDETYLPFFGNRKKLNRELKKRGGLQYIHGYRAKTPGATGSFCFLVISLCCNRIRIPIAITMVAVRERYQPWLEPQLSRLLRIVPRAIILADRGFGKATWFYLMLEKLGATYVVRSPLRKKENKHKVNAGISRFQHWMTEKETGRKVLLTTHVAKDEQERLYVLVSNIEKKTPRQLLLLYLQRWDIENIFKDSDRVQLPTSSRNPRMRLFTVVLSFFLFALWQFELLFPSMRWSLRTFVKNLMQSICSATRCIITTLGEIREDPS